MIKAILTDIEGTTSSLSFVKDVLFPYSRQRLAEYVRDHAENEQVKEILQQVREYTGQALNVDEIIVTLERWIDEDQKITPLKALQGMIWEAGYKNGDFTGHVYDDAAANMKKWHEQGVKLFVFSSGSVKAQKLIFGYSDFGDLTPLFSGYFDTTIGSKREVPAYQKIAEAISLPAAEILFLSDIEQELDAARDAGMQTIQLIREGQSQSSHPHVENFDQITAN